MELDKNNPLMCEGIIGDGCGGGRIFFIKKREVLAHDPIANEDITLFKIDEIPNKLTKKECVLYLEYDKFIIEFDLSTMQQRTINF